MKENILTIGSVVNLKKVIGIPYVIIGRGLVIKKGFKKVYVDYCGVPVPEGLADRKSLYYFNHEDIQEVVQLGYINDKELKYEGEYERMVSELGVKKWDGRE